MAGIVEYLENTKERFVSGMQKLERAGRGAIFGPSTQKDKMILRKRRLEQAIGGAIGGAPPASATRWRPKHSMKKRTKGR
jgi:hypothetical protein